MALRNYFLLYFLLLFSSILLLLFFFSLFSLYFLHLLSKRVRKHNTLFALRNYFFSLSVLFCFSHYFFSTFCIYSVNVTGNTILYLRYLTFYCKAIIFAPINFRVLQMECHFTAINFCVSLPLISFNGSASFFCNLLS